MTNQLTFAGMGELERHAVFSFDETYRYTLERYWDGQKPHVLFVLLNPSIADCENDDPTNRRGMGFAREWGFGGVVFCNLFAYRTPVPAEMKRQPEPIGHKNDRYLIDNAESAGEIIVAWGAHGDHLGRDTAVAELLSGFDLKCLGTNKNGSPKHILYLPKTAERVPWPGSNE